MSTQFSGPSTLTIPCHWNRDVIDQVTGDGKNIKVGEVYGVLAGGGPVGHGRARDAVVAVDTAEAISFRRFLREKGLKFTYLLNAPFKFKDDPELRRQLDEYLGWIIRDLQPDSLTISSYDLMRYVRSIDGAVPINISTIAGVKTVEDLKRFMDIKPSRVIPHHDVGKNLDDLKELVEFGKENGIQTEIMVTESCLYQCSIRGAHYEYLAHGTKDSPFHQTCNSRKLENPSEFLMAGGVVRPEDLEFYEGLGVGIFKITGRSKPAMWLPETANAYLQRRYDGNLIRLLGIDPSLRAEEWLYIDNRALDGFVTGFPFTKSVDDKKKYCDFWAAKLFEEGHFRVNDGSNYSTEGGRLCLVGGGGDKIAPIIQRERGR